MVDRARRLVAVRKDVAAQGIERQNGAKRIPRGGARLLQHPRLALGYPDPVAAHPCHSLFGHGRSQSTNRGVLASAHALIGPCIDRPMQRSAHVRLGSHLLGPPGRNLRRRARSRPSPSRHTRRLAHPAPGTSPACARRRGGPRLWHGDARGAPRAGGIPRSRSGPGGRDGRSGRQEGEPGSESPPPSSRGTQQRRPISQVPATLSCPGMSSGRCRTPPLRYGTGWICCDPADASCWWRVSWSTGAGLAASECERLVRAHRESVVVRQLSDSRYWGRSITDERYLAVSHR